MELSNEEFEKLREEVRYEVYELNEKEWEKLDEEIKERIRERKIKEWERRKKLDELRREFFDDRVLEFLKKKYERECIRWFRRIIKKRRFGGFKKVMLVKGDSYYWNVYIVGIDKDGREKVLISRKGGLVNLEKYK